MNFHRFTALSFLVLTAIGCGPTWVIVRQANPNPMVGRQSFAVEQLSFEGLMVGDKPEADYLSGKEQKSIDSFQNDKRDSVELFVNALSADLQEIGAQMVGGPGPGVITVRPHMTDYEPGNFNGFFNIPATVKMTIYFSGDGGVVLDEVNFSAIIAADFANPSSGQRMRAALNNIGRQVVRYLKTRVAPAQK